MNFLRDVFKIMGLVTLIVVFGMLLSVPTSLILSRAIETGSWLLGLLAFLLFITIVSIAVVAEDRLRG